MLDINDCKTFYKRREIIVTVDSRYLDLVYLE